MTIQWEGAVRDEARLRALHESGLPGTGPEDAFDRLVELAAELTGVACSCISLVDAETVACKSSIGLPEGMPFPRSVVDTFCRFVVGSGRPLIVDDAANDSRVFGDPAISEGTLCVRDIRPHSWTESDILMLATLARAASTEIALRKSNAELHRVRRELDDLRRRPSISNGSV
jgi:GAF domain-containing protein